MTEVVESEFRGLDLSQEPDNIAPGYLQLADNASLDGRDIITRPGFTALLSSAFSSAIRAYTPLAPISGVTERALFAADSALKYWAGSNTASSVSGAGTVAHNAAQLSLIGGAAFLSDGTANLKRVNIDTSGVPTAAASMIELDRPTGTITPALLHWNLMSNPAGSAWSQNYITGSVTTPGTSGNGDTVAPTSSLTETNKNFQGGFWTLSTGASVAGNMAQNGDKCVTLDSSWGGGFENIESTAMTMNPANTSGYARLAVIEYTVAAKTPPTDVPTEQVDLIVTPYDVTPAAIAAGVQTIRSPRVDSSNGAVVRALIDWRKLATEPRTMKAKWSLPNIHTAATQGVDVNHAAVYFPTQKLGISLDTDNRITITQGGVQVWGGAGTVASGAGQVTAITEPATSPPGKLLTAGLRMSKSQVITKADWLRARNIALEVFPGAGVSGLRIRVGGEESGTIYWSEPVQIPDGGGWSIADFRDQMSSLTTSTTVLWLEILDDVYIDGLQDAGNAIVCRVGGLRDVGNLVEGLDYWYVMGEMNSDGDSTLLDVIWSDGSAPTKSVRPTHGERMVSVTLPAKLNSTSTHLAVWRFGGSYLPALGDPAVPTGRLIALIPWSAPTLSWGEDYNKGGTSDYPLVFGNPYIQWDSTNRILYDNTPDSWLSGVMTYSFAREKAPSTPVAVASWDSRLWASSGADLYASWAIQPGRTKGVYWTKVNEPSDIDPEAQTKGWYVRLAVAAGDSIVRIIPAGISDTSTSSGQSAPAMLVLTKRTAFSITHAPPGRRGTSAQNQNERYVVKELVGDDIRGAVSIYAAAVFEDWVWWMSDRGLLRWRAGLAEPERMGDKVRRLLPGISPSMTYTAGAQAAVTLTAGVHYLYLGTPSDESVTNIDKTLVWHSREQGWTRWGKAFAGGAGEVMAGIDGQLWRVGGNGDTTTVGGQAGAVTLSMQTRRIGDGRMVSNPGWLFYSVYLPGATNGSLTFTVLGDGTTGASVTQTILGDISRRVRVSRSGAGRRTDISLSAATVRRIRVRALGIDLIPTHHRRV